MTDLDTNDDESPQTGAEAGVAKVGDRGHAVSFQILQDIYNDITGRSEKITVRYKDLFQLELNDLAALNRKIEQFYEQYHINTSNCTVAIFYLNNEKQQFSSFSRFMLQGATSSSPVESVLVTYKFLIVLPKLNRPQSYTLAVRLISKIALEKKLEEDFPFDSAPIFRLMGGSTATVEIEYVDYVVAKSAQSVLSGWFEVLPKENDPKIIKFIQAKSYWISRASRLLTIIVVTLIVVQTMPRFVSPVAQNLLEFGQFIVLASLGIYGAQALASWSGSYVENSIDRWSGLSYLKFNQADVNLIKEISEKNRKTLVKSSISLCGTLLISVITKLIASALIFYFGIAE